MSKLKVIIAGGGTGGHIFPAVAIGHALQRLQPGTELLFVGALGKMEMEKVPQEGFNIIGLDIVGFNRANLLKNIMLPYRLLKSRWKASSILKEFQPHVVIGVGGYASFPMLSAAQAAGVPTLIQEQNSYAGKSNKILAQKANAVCVAYEGMNKFFPASKLLITGNPVRKAIADMQGNADEARKTLGLDINKPVVLVIGGSLGAKSINESIDAGVAKILESGAQLLWQTGSLYEQRAKELAAKYSDVKTFTFIKNMPQAYLAADVVVSRAGALSIAELCIAAKPVIFVPYPFAAEDHQTSNAKALVDKGAAILVKDADAPSRMVNELVALLADKQKQQQMSVSIKAMAIADADERIAKKVIEIANK